MEVLVVVGRVRTPQARGKLTEEELKYVAKFIVGVRSVRSKESEDIGKTASCKSFDSSVFVKEDRIMDQFLADCRECTGIDAVLVQLRKLGVEALQLLEKSICREALSNELVMKLELLGRGLTTSASLGYHDAREEGSVRQGRTAR
jgi:hypothetical protein